MDMKRVCPREVYDRNNLIVSFCIVPINHCLLIMQYSYHFFEVILFARNFLYIPLFIVLRNESLGSAIYYASSKFNFFICKMCLVVICEALSTVLYNVFNDVSCLCFPYHMKLREVK